jgi:hypothetical protein
MTLASRHPPKRRETEVSAQVPKTLKPQVPEDLGDGGLKPQGCERLR